MSAVRRRVRPLLLVPAVLALSACPQVTAVWLAPGATADHLTLILGRERGRERPVSAAILVTRCGEPSPATAETPFIASVQGSRVTLGRPGPGVRIEQWNGPLAPGCYVAHLSGTGSVAFRVEPNGRVVELGDLPPSGSAGTN
ncbi:MAG TPA: hypothetical protein VFQ45_03740 [Longimicrobium sp.]|nr:hypothetical protein [Longimicrobium sp.]